MGRHAGEVVDGGPDPVGDDGRGQLRPPGDQPGQPVVAVELPDAVGAFGDPVGDADQRVARAELGHVGVDSRDLREILT